MDGGSLGNNTQQQRQYIINKPFIHTHTHTFTPVRSVVRNTGYANHATRDHPFFHHPKKKSLNTVLNFQHPKLPISSNTFPCLPSHSTPFPVHPSSIPVQPCYYLIMLKVSQKPGFGPKS